MLRLVVADDEPLERQAIRLVLESQRPGYRVVAECGDGAGVVALAQELLPDVCLLDVRMPEMDGLAAGRMIRDLIPDSRLIFVTATTSLPCSPLGRNPAEGGGCSPAG